MHPALPGTFPGTHGIERTYEAYQRGEIEHTGVMVHLVPDEAVDAGPVVLQEEVPIYPVDSLDDLETRIHAVEHRLLPQAVYNLLCSQEPLAVKRHSPSPRRGKGSLLEKKQ